MTIITIIALLIFTGLVVGLCFAASHYDHGKRPW